MGAFRSKKGQILHLPFWHVPNPWVLRGCRALVFLCMLGLIYMLRFTPFVPSLSGEDSMISIDEDDIIENLVTEQTGNVLGRYHGESKERDVPVTDGSDTFFLAAVIFNRVFKEDLFNITAYECKQWIEYMLFSGVEHIFWYDTAHSDEESQELHLREYVRKGSLTYHRFHHIYPNNLDSGYHFEQDHSYEHFLGTHSSKIKWVVEMDVDEYPFMPQDVQSSFLRRYLNFMRTSNADVTQILMPCMIFGGNPMGDEEDGWVIERYQRRKRDTEGDRPGYSSRTKPIFQPKHAKGVSYFDPHQFPMRDGETIVTAPETLRMNHYWGPRLSDFKPDTPSVIALLIPDDSAQPIASELKARTGLTSKLAALTVV